MSADASRVPAPAASRPATSGGAVAVFERRQFERALAASVVSAPDWQKLEELDALLARVNALYEEAGAEIEAARDRGQSAGFSEGLARAQQQMTEQLASLNERRARVLNDAAGRITDLACAIVARIAPQFDARAVVPPLVMQAVEAAQAEQFLLIRVHPSVRENVSAGLGAVRQAHPAVGVIELVDDLSLDPMSCVVVSEAGEVRAGVSQQIEAIRTALAGAGGGHMTAGTPLISDPSANDPLLDALARVQSIERVGRVAEAYGTLIRATGLKAAIGELCILRNPADGGGDPDFRLPAEVVGVSRQHTLLTPLGALDGIAATTEVVATGRQASVRVGPGLLGRILDAHGEPIDDLGPIAGGEEAPIYAASPNPLTRKLIERPFSTGVRAIDTTMTAGEGQRIGIFAVAGGGKSTLLGMLARGGDAEVNVIVLVGERGREVNEFIHDNLGPEGLAKSVIVVATSDRPALERSRAAWVGTAIAEYFRDRGQRVLLLLDSVTRFARALRDVGLAVGEPPARRGFPPSVFSALPRLFERAGNNDRGSITAFYTVLAEDEDGGDPIVEEVRSILDGHIVLSRKLAAAYHYPAIDVLHSLSRTMPRVVESPHLRAAGQLRKYLAKHQDIELLLQLGEYKRGTDPDADIAIEKIEPIRKLLQQSSSELVPFAQSSEQLRKLFG